MAENVPPSSIPATNTLADQPGRPYYESLRAILRSTLDKKRKLDEQLAALEDQIFKTEGTYLEDTSGSGNVVRGFDGWVKGVTVGGTGGGRGGADDRRRGRIRDEDRIFSRSSVGWMKAQEGPDSNTPSHAPTPTGSFGGGANSARESNAPTPAAGGGNSKSTNKKKRPVEKEEEEDSKATKRGKISYARD